MVSLIKGARYVPEAVVLGDRPSRGFSLGAFTPRDSRVAPSPDAKSVEQERLETAKLQAERLVAEAEARASEIAREATIEGYEAGFAEGMRRAGDQCQELVARLSQIVENALVDHDMMVLSAQREAAALALAMASKIVNREISMNEDSVLDTVRGALERIPSAGGIRVLVNPEDDGLLRERWGEIAGGSARGLEWELATDPKIGRGGCVIEAQSGFVDSRIETQMAKLVAAFEAEQ